jgi:hypothetical protein
MLVSEIVCSVLGAKHLCRKYRPILSQRSRLFVRYERRLSNHLFLHTIVLNLPNNYRLLLYFGSLNRNCLLLHIPKNSPDMQAQWDRPDTKWGKGRRYPNCAWYSVLALLV